MRNILSKLNPFRCFDNTTLLFKKNWRVITRNPSYLLVFLLAPLMSVVYITYIEAKLQSKESSMKVINFPESPLLRIPRCPSPQGCTTLGYFVIVYLLSNSRDTWKTGSSQ